MMDMPQKPSDAGENWTAWQVVWAVLFLAVLFAPEICFLLGIENQITFAMQVFWRILWLVCLTLAIPKKFSK
jgi:hypothetical protein